MTKIYKIYVYGKVQGVGFRFTSYLAFGELNLKGKAENMKDGSVYIEAIGEEPQLERFVQWVKKGPEGARVRDVQVTKENYDGQDEQKETSH